MIKVIEFPLATSLVEIDNFQKRMKVACDVYNDLNHYYQKRYREMTLSKEWAQLNHQLVNEYRKLDELNAKKGSKKQKKTTPEIKEIYNVRNKIMQDYEFSEFGFTKKVAMFASKYAKLLPSTMAALSIAKRLWVSYEKLFFGNGDRVHFKRRDQFNSLSTDGKSGMRFLHDDKGFYIFLSNRNAKAKEYKVYIKGPKNDYEEFALHEIEKNGVKIVSLIRRIERNKPSFYVQLTYEGESYEKLDLNGKPKHIIHSGRVALNIINGHLIAINDEQIKYWNLLEGYNEHNERLSLMQTKANDIRFSLNQENYDENGVPKKGIYIEGVRHKLKWKSNHILRELNKAIKEEHRINTIKQNLRYRKIVWELLNMGDDFIVYDTPYNIKREKPEFDPDNIPPQKEMRKKARERRAIQGAAPSKLLTYLQVKLSMIGKSELKKVRVPEHIFWYQHEKDDSDEKYYLNNIVRIKGTEISGYEYHSFILYFYDPANESLNKKSMNKAFSKYF